MFVTCSLQAPHVLTAQARQPGSVPIPQAKELVLVNSLSPNGWFLHEGLEGWNSLVSP
jgi:hypothetical protein